ncbi:hypothetical protein M3Y95_00357300 [Aphelenchoides besseyi]|nr:hypothetical protein M3Y95_00357300 [Aphelenchoides besseyi]
MRLLSIFGFLFFVLFVVVLADYEKNDTNVDVHSDKLLLREGPPLKTGGIKCLCYRSYCMGHIQDCPIFSCYQMFGPFNTLLHRGCFFERKFDGWIRRRHFKYQFCNKDECNDELPR